MNRKRFSTTALLDATLSLALGVVATTTAGVAAQPADPVHHARFALKGRYIVRLRQNADPVAFGVAIEQLGRGRVRHVYRRAISGIALQTTEAEARALASDPTVASVTEDGLTWGTVQSQSVDDGTWGLDRIDQRSIGPDGQSAYDHLYRYSADGVGVHIYVLDSGVRTTHTEFAGRAFPAFDTRPYDPPGDCNGHGTHVAGIAAGVRFGVAKNATVHSVRVLGCDNGGSVADLIAGIDWITANRVLPAVINMSIGAGRVDVFDDAARAAIASGITFVASAGNSSGDACQVLTGGVPEIIVAAASDGADARAWFSNGGGCVDVFAPGVFIPSAYRDGDDSVAFLSGTSMASPHVAGAAALYLQNRPHASPREVADVLTRTATPSVIRDPLGAPNRLLFTPHLGDRTPPAVSIVSPSSGAVVGGHQPVRLVAEDDVELSSVTVKGCGVELGRVSDAPLTVDWYTGRASNGQCWIEAQARDLAGNIARSAVSVIVRNRSQHAAPVLALAPARRQLWPPNGKLVPVTFAGRVAGAEITSVAFRTIDEYGRVQPSGTAPVEDGRFQITVPLESSRRGKDRDGREYTIAVTATSADGRHATTRATVVVGHNAHP